MDKLDMFQARFEKMDKFGLWGLEIISADSGAQFTSTEFQDECKTHGVTLTLEVMEHQEVNGKFKVTCRTMYTITYSLMVQAKVSEAYIHFALMYMSDHILKLLPFKDLINEDGELNRSFKFSTGTKPSISLLNSDQFLYLEMIYLTLQLFESCALHVIVTDRVL